MYLSGRTLSNSPEAQISVPTVIKTRPNSKGKGSISAHNSRLQVFIAQKPRQQALGSASPTISMVKRREK